MSSRISGSLPFAFILLAAAPNNVWAGPNPTYHVDSFKGERLFAQFDTNKNGTLEDKEKRMLWDTFGGIDVPLLPDEPFDYTHVELPPPIKAAQLRQSDNTPDDNPMTDQGAMLGRVLFYDKQLSRNDTISCASCHDQRAGFSDPRRFSVGFQGGLTKRNAMGLANIRYSNLNGHRPGFFWDERAPSLEVQALMPIQDKVEMGMELTELEKKLQDLPYYPPLFEAAFGSTKITSDGIAKALAQFMRSMVSLNSKFNQSASEKAKNGGDSEDFAKFTEEENLGKSLFMDGVRGIAELGCARCHVPPTFNMDKAQNIGLELKYKDQGLGVLDRRSNDPFTPSNNGKFKASSLQNIELMAPYMHDGRFKTLEQVVEHYSTGVHLHENLALAVKTQNDAIPTTGVHFTEAEKKALVAFLKTLTDWKFVTDPRFSDPFIRANN